jgi:hypothetical protein
VKIEIEKNMKRTHQTENRHEKLIDKKEVNNIRRKGNKEIEGTLKLSSLVLKNLFFYTAMFNIVTLVLIL